mgnify:CR=1 FL=1
MSLYNVFNITGTGMSAQSIRLNTTASNLANAQTVASSVNETYKARHPVFSAIFDDAFLDSEQKGAFDADGGVRVMGIVESKAPYDLRYEPHHPMADEKGYVTYPNVNVVEEILQVLATRFFRTSHLKPKRSQKS